MTDAFLPDLRRGLDLWDSSGAAEVNGGVQVKVLSSCDVWRCVSMDGVRALCLEDRVCEAGTIVGSEDEQRKESLS